MEISGVCRLMIGRFLPIVSSRSSVLYSHTSTLLGCSSKYILAFVILYLHLTNLPPASINHESRRTIHHHYICYRTLHVNFLSSPTLNYATLNYMLCGILIATNTNNNNNIKKPAYSTKSTIRLISTLPKLPPWTNYPTVTRKCTAVAGNLVHFHCVMDLTWLITRRLGTTLAL